MAPLAEESANLDNTPTRHILGHVSPNIRVGTPTVVPYGEKTVSGNPLKRSLTTAMQVGQGFTYLKRRKLSEDDYSTDLSNRSIEQTRVKQRGPQDESQVNMDSASVQRVGFEQFVVSECYMADICVAQLDIPVIQQLSPTEPNTPTPSFSGDEARDSSTERKSFSSLINYDPSSQNAPSSQPTSRLVFNGPSYAELLQLRLRVAMFKVRTNQTSVPFADLQVEVVSDDHGRSNTARSSPALARKDVIPSVSLGRGPMSMLLPAPVLRPTANSCYQTQPGSLPSSPQLVTNAEKLIPGPGISTPTSVNRTAWREDKELTSSIVKGRVAEGLLGLRNAH